MTMQSRASSAWNVFFLALLYFSQGLPFGFQKTLSVFLRNRGMSLSNIGFTQLLSLPWMLKVLWAPVVDVYYLEKIGRRKSWIIPMQLSLVLLCLMAAYVTSFEETPVTFLLIIVFFINLCAATQDIAVDGLAVEMLSTTDLGKGNISQTVGFKCGMLMGGGILIWVSDVIGWPGLFLCMSGILLVILGTVLVHNEKPTHAKVEDDHSDPPLSMKSTIHSLFQTIRYPWMKLTLLLIFTYKFGEAMMDAMWKPFLVDVLQLSASEIGILSGMLGMAFSIAGSILGGVLTDRLTPLPTLTLSLLLRCVPLLMKWYLAFSLENSDTKPTEQVSWLLVTSLCSESFFGGMLTVPLFAFMMMVTQKFHADFGASCYTLLATVEVIGKAIPSIFSGFLAESLGYTRLFALGTALSLLVIPLTRNLMVVASIPDASLALSASPPHFKDKKSS